ncbi:hypothetical protein HNR40_009759 [Nonomuraea endophytica]|uniref:Uncharacterized protein n=1 Tax=Nonomuraea endophytica TaxID=714136 RepID=A0A7W8EKH3_9ACTN|nr:hypothetical protein [Nonomuraea endophytica]
MPMPEKKEHAATTDRPQTKPSKNRRHRPTRTLGRAPERQKIDGRPAPARTYIKHPRNTQPDQAENRHATEPLT